MHITYYRSVREAHSGIIVWTIKIIENTIKTIKMIYKQYILQIYNTHDKENETPVIKQNLGNWYCDYFRCI